MSPTKTNRTQRSDRRLLKFELMDIEIYGFLLFMATFADTWMTMSAAKLNPTIRPLPGKVQNVEQNCYSNDCRTRECIHAASDILKYINESVNPCDNFYKFACGRFNDTSLQFDSFSARNMIPMVDKKTTNQVKSIIEADMLPNEIKPFKMVKKFYISCMNKTNIKARGLKPLQKILRKLGGWPVVEGEKWKEDAFDWINVMYKVGYNEGLKHSHFFDISVVVDMKNTTRRVIRIGQATNWLLREELLTGFENELMQKYYNYMVGVAVILGAPENLAKAELKKALLFQIDLAMITEEDQKLLNETALYNPMGLTELEKKYSSVRWRDILTELMPLNVSLRHDELVIVQFPSYVEKFEELLKNTTKKTQANYLIWKLIENVLSLLENDEIRKKYRPVDALFRIDTIKNPPRWKDCMNLVLEHLPVSVSAMYMRQYVDPDMRQMVADMFDNIKHAFMKKMKKYKWMDETTRKASLDKAEALIKTIGYSDELMNDSNLENFYNNIKLSKHAYFTNTLKLQRFESESSFRRLREPVNKKDWTIPISIVQARVYYNTDDNGIIITAGILQGVFFNKNRPKYMNYGALGSTIAGSIIHVFDELGRQWDKNGHLIDLWQPPTEKAYRKRAKHIIDLYNNYTVDRVGFKINGSSIHVENIADIGGVKTAYLAYQAWVGSHSEEQTLPGVNYTTNQLFWISMGNSHCSKYGLEELKRLIADESYTPDEFRVIGPVSNNKFFAKDFQCPSGSKMNPEKKRSVW